MAALRYPRVRVAVDWPNAGDQTFAGPEDYVTNRTLSPPTGPGVSIQWGTDSNQPDAEPLINTAAFVLGNWDSKYSIENPTSPIYQQILPGREVYITAEIGEEIEYDADIGYDEPILYDGLAKLPMFFGVIDDLNESIDLNNYALSIGCFGTFTRLQNLQITTALYSAKRTDELLTILLDAAGWPADKRRLAIGDSTVAYFWMSNESIFERILNILATEGPGAKIYEEPDGTFVFENRNFRGTQSRSLNPQVLIFDQQGGEIIYDADISYDADIFYDGSADVFASVMDYNPGFKEVYNDITVSYTVRSVPASNVVAWQLGADLSLSGSETRVIFANMTDPLTNVQTVTVTTDYLVTLGSLTSVTTNQISATTVVITLVAGVGGATVTGPAGGNGIQIRGKPLTALADTYTKNDPVTVDVSQSIARFKKRSKSLTNLREISYGLAQTLADLAAIYYKDPRPPMVVTIDNANSLHTEHQVLRKISDRIKIINNHTQFNGDVWINQIQQKIVKGRLTTIWICEKVINNTPALWGQDLGPLNVWTSANDNPALPANTGAGKWGQDLGPGHDWDPTDDDPLAVANAGAGLWGF